MSLQEVQAVTGGVLTGRDASFSALSIDTRTLNENDLFVALQGPNFDGNQFVATACEKHASAAVVGQQVMSDLPMLVVEDTRLALGKIGAMNRERSTACVIALTGSQGKTTVKEMTAAILGKCGEVTMARGNLNNDRGVPLTLAGIEQTHEFAVIELGANGPGEIAYTVSLTRPRIGHITNIAGTHLEGFGSLDGVARAKGEIWEGIQEGGTAVINLDDEYAARFLKALEEQPVSRQVVTVSAKGNPAADYRAKDIVLKGFLGSAFRVESPQGQVDISLDVVGLHNVGNALAATALAMSAGAGLEQVQKGLAGFHPVKGRMNILAGLNDAIVIDDTYNASPSSFRAAIDVLALTSGRKIVVMGDMGELGDYAQQAHREIGEYARDKEVNELIAVGNHSRLAVECFGERGVYLEQREAFLDVIQPMLDEETTVLIKGSRSQRMEILVQQLLTGDI